jgi:CRP/FNR family transcriptional regulator
MTTLAKLLKENTLFAALNEADRAEVARQAIQRTYPNGQLFALAGEAWPYLFLIETGTVNVVKESSEGRSLILLSLGPGEIFWGLGFFQDQASMPAMLEAQETSRLHLWSRDRLLPLLLQNSQVLWDLCRLVVSRVERASDIVDDLAFNPVAGRLARFLLDQFVEPSYTPIARTLTLEEMAARIGTTREMVCRILHRFSQEGMLDLTRTEFVFTDRSKLEQVAGKS